MGLLAVSKVIFMLLWPFLFLLIPFFQGQKKIHEQSKTNY